MQKSLPLGQRVMPTIAERITEAIAYCRYHEREGKNGARVASKCEKCGRRTRCHAERTPATHAADMHAALQPTRDAACSSMRRPESGDLTPTESDDRIPAGTSRGANATAWSGQAVAAAVVVGAAALAMFAGAAHAAEAAYGLDASDSEAAAKAAEVAAALAAGTYKPSPVEGPGDEVWIGFIAGVIPFAIGSWEFGKRIIIQQRCQVCSGKGLVPSSREGAKYVRKCPQCGGFFPWVSWKMFLTSTAAPGNGGPLQYPKGQTSVFFKVPPKPVEVPDLPPKSREVEDKEHQGVEMAESKASERK